MFENTKSDISDLINNAYVVARKTELGISGFGISVTTMEEVFIKVGEGTDETLERRYTISNSLY